MLAIADVAVTVSNARDTAKWWHEKLGFGVHIVDGPKGHAVVVAPPGGPYLLHLCEGFERVEPGNTGIAFMTDDIDEIVHRLTAGGVRLVEPLQKRPWGGSAKFADPDGNVFWLVGAPRKFIRTEAARRAPPEPRRRPRARSPRPRAARK